MRTPAGGHEDVAWSYPMVLPYAVDRVGIDFSGYVAFDSIQVRFLESRADIEML